MRSSTAIAIVPACAALLFCATAAFAQSPSFEAAVIKPSPPAERHSIRIEIDNIHADIPDQSLLDLIVRAYAVNVYRISGPDWMKAARFDIDAKLPANSTADQVPQMLQSLLADRFKLAVHRETRTMPVFNLIAGKGSSKLQLADDSVPSTSPKRVSGGMTEIDLRMTMPAFASLLTNLTGRPVNDKTGLAGKYRMVIALPLVPAGETGPVEDESSSLYASVELLGLKLDSQKEPVETIVIDHLEKTPTGN